MLVIAVAAPELRLGALRSNGVRGFAGDRSSATPGLTSDEANAEETAA
jgi:hypothetical protein